MDSDENTSPSTLCEDDALKTTALLSDLIRRAKCLMAELEIFRLHLRSVRQEHHIEAAHFRSTVQSELTMLERLTQKPKAGSSGHIARSSNLPFLESVWNAAKRSPQLTALHKRLYFDSPNRPSPQAMRHASRDRDQRRPRERKNAAVTVDAITHGGLVWTKLSLVTNTRLLFDLAKLGWQSDGSEEDNYDDFQKGAVDDPDDDVPIVKAAKDLCQAAKSYRIRTRHPAVHLLLPRVEPGKVDEVDAILDVCRAAGAVVVCGQLPEPQSLDDDALQRMAANPISSFSETLNIDCTILLALVSEFSHAKVSKEPWFHTALKRQVEIEGNENLLPSLLYPALGKHELVCTQEAAKRMREIVDTIGTPSEKARTAIMMGDETSKSQNDLVLDMQKWSAYPVPADWQLPIAVVDSNENDAHRGLPPQAIIASEDMTDINKSVFLHGWATGRTTITSNRTVVKQIESDLDKYDELDDSIWPKIWLCPTARSLVGKEKRGAKKEGAWPLPDPLRREQQRRNGLDVLTMREGHEVEDLRPNGYPCQEVLEAKNASRANGSGAGSDQDK